MGRVDGQYLADVDSQSHVSGKCFLTFMLVLLVSGVSMPLFLTGIDEDLFKLLMVGIPMSLLTPLLLNLILDVCASSKHIKIMHNL